jgi:hypothetical protein
MVKISSITIKGTKKGGMAHKFDKILLDEAYRPIFGV